MKPSEIVAAAAEAAVRAMRHPDISSSLTRAELQAMYDAQCEATDEWEKRAKAAEHAKAPATLQARIKELEGDLATVNRRLGSSNDADLAVNLAAIAAKNALDNCDHPDCIEDRERTGYSCCAGGHLARTVVKAILGHENIGVSRSAPKGSA